MGKGENNGYFRNCCSQRLESCWMQTTNRSMKVCNLLWSRSFLDLDSRSFEYKKTKFYAKKSVSNAHHGQHAHKYSKLCNRKAQDVYGSMFGCGIG